MNGSSIFLTERDRIKWEPDLLKIVFKDFDYGLLLPAFSVVIGIVYSLCTDFNIRDFQGSLIKCSLLIICLLYIIFFKYTSRSGWDWHLILVTLLFLGKVELYILNIDGYFYEPEKWILIPILMLYHAFYFKYIPKLFISYWFILLFYYHFRIAKTPYANYDSFQLNGMYTYIIPFYIFASGFNYLWLRNRYTNLVYIRDLERETAKRIEIEKELATQKTTRAMIEDIHEHIGSSIQDFKLNLFDVLKNVKLDEELIREIYSSVYRTEDALRININSSSDINYIQEDLFIGLKIILFRRYEIFRRQVRIQHNELQSSDFLELKNPDVIRQIYMVCREVCSNDLKYGMGTAEWSWKYDNGLQLTMSSRTRYDEIETGKGTKSIINRMGYLNGTVVQSISGGRFYSTFQFPFLKRENIL